MGSSFSTGRLATSATPPEAKLPAAPALDDGNWREIKPKGDLPVARWSPGEGIYHPKHNVLVCYQPNGIWVYRHQTRVGQ